MQRNMRTQFIKLKYITSIGQVSVRKEMAYSKYKNEENLKEYIFSRYGQC